MKPLAQMVVRTRDVNFSYAVVEHWAVLAPGQPPELVYVFVTSFTDAFIFKEAVNNTKWAELFGKPEGVEILIQVIATAKTRVEANSVCVTYLRTLPKRPICNLQGMVLHGRQRRIIAEDGREWRTQAEAAQDLGVSQSTIAAHLSGRQKHVRGVRLAYGSMV